MSRRRPSTDTRWTQDLEPPFLTLRNRVLPSAYLPGEEIVRTVAAVSVPVFVPTGVTTTFVGLCATPGNVSRLDDVIKKIKNSEL